MITDLELLLFAKRGLIPGPNEDEKAFLQRASKLESFSPEDWKEAHAKTEKLYGFAIDWVSCTYSNHKLPFWEGAATWISEEGIPSIQLRNGFKKGKYLGYTRSEVLAHEAVHAARSAFEEPRFEEILAYRTSTNFFRKCLGPLFRKPKESLLFLLFFPLGIFFLFRLLRDQWIFQGCLQKLPLPVILCLTDKEIARFAEIKPDSSLRWRMINLMKSSA